MGPSQPCSPRSGPAAGAPCAWCWGLHRPAWAVARERAGSLGVQGQPLKPLGSGGALAGWALGQCRQCAPQAEQRFCHAHPGSLGRAFLCYPDPDAPSLGVHFPWDFLLTSWVQQARGASEGRAPWSSWMALGLEVSSCSPGSGHTAAFLFKPTFVACVSFSPLLPLFI